ncbi:glycoside hydrolase family 32 protein [Rhizobium calliandrae]|uniref:beta-fructofuranosidase n=1 Tax=Rhizobium calliandrae TaxID=1312182 RepID=A0ABT7KHE6_9HYPH|nr:glycoside hydrolase family 32 protein [Rhizobium calliandrae]MDL2408061.1 glycoside hydrolase family 32 protein [Rhizobium calliandrae]
MIKLKILQAGALTLHLWQRPLSGDGNRVETSSVCVRASDGTHCLDAGPTHDFQLHVAALFGPATIEWDESDTEVSLAYVFRRERVATEGITVLFTTARNAPACDRFLCHLKPPFGWMNDPNGMSLQGDRLHLFYQHYPHARRWSAMHWGHAATDNLIDWVHYPIFLSPDKELLADRQMTGGVFSGSAVPMPDGSLRAFYTDREDDRLPNWEWQKTVLSRDWITAGAPQTIIQDRPPEPDAVRDNRDAYVFKGDDGRWKLLLGGADKAGGVIYLYETTAEDAASDWRYVGIFYRETIGGSLPLECPCLIPLHGAGEGLHLLIFGIIGMRDKTTLRRHLSFGVVGRLQGDRLLDTRRFEMDFGTDAYAFQAISQARGPLAIAWAANWADVFKELDFPSAMTFPRTISFDGTRLRTPPAAAVDGLRTNLLAQGPLATFTTLELPNGLADIRLDNIDGVGFEIEFVHPEFGLRLTYDGVEMELHFNAGNRVTPRYLRHTGRINDVRILIDRGLLEIFADGGAHCCTKRFDSAVPIRIVRMTSSGDDASGTFEAYELRAAKTFIHYQENDGRVGG